VAVGVYEAGRCHQALGVDNPLRLDAPQSPDGRDGVVFYGYIPPKPGSTGSVDDLGASYEEIVNHS